MRRSIPLLATGVLAVAAFAAAPAASAQTATAQAPHAVTVQAAVARALTAARTSLLHASAHDAFAEKALVRDASGVTHVHVTRTYRGLRVIGGDAVLHVAADGSVRSATQTLTAPLTLGVKASVAATTAARAAGSRSAGATLVVWARTSTPRLAWEVVVRGTQRDGTPSERHVVVDARAGRVLDSWDAIETSTGNGFHNGTVSLTTTKANSTTYQLKDGSRGNTATYDANNKTSSAKGTLFTDSDDVWGTGSLSSRQTSAVDAQYGTAETWDFYKSTFGRTGIKGDGVGSYNRVHYGSRYNNAFWSDSCFCMTYGDGDGTTYNPFDSLDVAGHEQTHGVTSNTAGLVYSGESGGLNESMSDVFGTLVEFYANNSNDAPDYLIGEKLTKDGSPLRWMSKPSLDGASADCYSSNVGNLDVHYSSGVANHAFYLVAVGSGGSGYGSSPTCNGSSVSGIGNAAAGAIWYKALTSYMTSNTNFKGARTATLSAASDLYGSGSSQYAAVAAAWSGVGVN